MYRKTTLFFVLMAFISNLSWGSNFLRDINLTPFPGSTKSTIQASEAYRLSFIDSKINSETESETEIDTEIEDELFESIDSRTIGQIIKFVVNKSGNSSDEEFEPEDSSDEEFGLEYLSGESDRVISSKAYTTRSVGQKSCANAPDFNDENIDNTPPRKKAKKTGLLLRNKERNGEKRSKTTEEI